MAVRGAAAVAVTLLAGGAQAQLAGALTLASDEQLRGLSLSYGRPSLTAALSYDDRSGLYASAAAIGVNTRERALDLLGARGTVGYARRLSSRLSFDAGVNLAAITIHGAYEYDASYVELHAGLTRGAVGYHLFVSPDYLSLGAATLYQRIDATRGLDAATRVFAQAGLLTPFGDGDQRSPARTRVDLKLGIGRRFGRLDLSTYARWSSSRRNYAGFGRDRSPPVAALLTASF